MKKIISIIMVMVMMIVLCCGCSATKVVIETKPTDSEEAKNVKHLLEQYVLDLENFDVPVSEYGESTSYLMMDKKLLARIIYPSGDIPALDETVKEWIDGLVLFYQNQVIDEKEPSELTVEYSSYKVADKFVSIKMNGVFQSNSLAHPLDIVATFNGNEETKEVVLLDDILLTGGREKLQQMVIDEANLDETVVDENLLKNWILKNEGVEIILPRGSYMPMSEGSKVINLSFENLKGIVDFDAKQIKEKEKAIEEEKNNKNEVIGNIPANDIDPSKPMIALTFDDGPSPHTERLLDIFAQNGGRGTFFVVGNLVEGRADVVKRTIAEGHQIGNHSWSHRNLKNLSKQEATDQIMSTRAKVYDITGYDVNIVRPPYGACDSNLKALGKELGCAFVNWSVDTEDWKTKNADAVYSAIMRDVKDGAIILCHDLHKTTVDAMERVIPELIAQGYQLVTVNELLTSDGSEIVPGEMYYNK